MAGVEHSWAANEGERDAWIAYVRGVEGFTINSVRYLDLDYRRHEVAPQLQGPRPVGDLAEWDQPSWLFPGGHTVDFGIELAGSGRVWSVGWIPPGRTEGLAVYACPLIPAAISAEAAVAVWDVSEQAPWQTVLGQPIQAVQAHYKSWDDARTWWCPRLEFVFPTLSIEMSLAQGTLDGTIKPAADNIVVGWASR